MDNYFSCILTHFSIWKKKKERITVTDPPAPRELEDRARIFAHLKNSIDASNVQGELYLAVQREFVGLGT